MLFNTGMKPLYMTDPAAAMRHMAGSIPGGGFKQRRERDLILLFGNIDGRFDTMAQESPF